MWCEKCQADVAAEVSPETSAVHCANCQSVIQSGALARATEKTRKARELLERWSTAPLPGATSSVETRADRVSSDTDSTERQRTTAVSPILGNSKTASSTESRTGVATKPQASNTTSRVVDRLVAQSRENLEESGRVLHQSAAELEQKLKQMASATTDAQRKVTTTPDSRAEEFLRLDAAHPAGSSTSRSENSDNHDHPFPQATSQPSLSQNSQSQTRFAESLPKSTEPAAMSTSAFSDDQVSGSAAFNTQFTETRGTSSRRSSVQSFWGQMLAYAGVLTITVGAVMVLLAWFGTPEQKSLAPTGWLIVTTGQMLLFLGLTTCMSGGIDHVNAEVSQQLSALSQRLADVEQITQQTQSLVASRAEAGESRAA